MPGNDIFGFTDATSGGVFTDAGNLAVIGNGDEFALAQQWSVQYQLQMQPLYECGKSTVYWAVKHTPGQFSCDRVIGPGMDALKALFNVKGRACEGGAFSVEAGSGTCKEGSGGRVKMTMDGAFPSGFSASGQAQSPYAIVSVQMSFAGLYLE